VVGGIGNVFADTDILTGETIAKKQLRVELTRNMPEMVERFLGLKDNSGQLKPGPVHLMAGYLKPDAVSIGRI
jgi:hypothetical protein